MKLKQIGVIGIAIVLLVGAGATNDTVNGRPVLSNVVGIAKKSYNSLQLAVLINILVF